MSTPSNAKLAKVVLLGESTVGKTCTVLRYVNDTYSESPPTVAANFFTKEVYSSF